LLTDLGFKEYMKSSRMYLGKPLTCIAQINPQARVRCQVSTCLRPDPKSFFCNFDHFKIRSNDLQFNYRNHW
jgi:hypothetical protein